MQLVHLIFILIQDHNQELIKKDTLFIKVSIVKYWTWVNVGIWQSDLVTDISTDIKTNNFDTFNIDATESVGIHLGTDSNALKSINNAIKKFRSEAINKFKKLRERQ